MNALRTCVVLAVGAAILGGCCGGGSTKVQSTTTTTTGQQLIDLKKAYTEGAITEEQYNKMKKQVLESSGGE